MTVTGTNIEVGDIIGSGTISGPEIDTWGSLMEMSWNGERPLKLGD